MEIFWTAGIVGLTVLDVVYSVVMLYFAKEVGTVLVRMGPTFARPSPEGLQIGSAIEELTITSEDGKTHGIGGLDLDPLPTLFLFVSPRCPACHELTPALKAFRRAYRHHLRVVAVEVSQGESSDDKYARSLARLGVIYTRDGGLRERFDVNGVPYAVLLDRRNVLVAKGTVNNLQQLESLFSIEVFAPKGTRFEGGDGTLEPSSFLGSLSLVEGSDERATN